MHTQNKHYRRFGLLHLAKLDYNTDRHYILKM